MDNDEILYIRLDCWDDAVGAFEPAKVLRQLQRSFPDAEIDPTDHQRVRLLRELEFWAQGDTPAELRETLVRQSWGLYQRNGPMYRFVIHFPSGHHASGAARRMSVGFDVPAGFPIEYRGQLVAFLRSIRMGEPVWDEDREDAAAETSSDGEQ